MSESKTPRTDAVWEGLKGEVTVYLSVAQAQPISVLLRTIRKHSDELETELSVALQCAEKAGAELEELQKRCDQLTGMKFSDRMHAALINRAESAEAELSRYLKAEKALPEESRMVGRVRMLEDKKQGEQACLDYIDKLRAHAAAVTAERDAVLEAL